MIKLKKFLILLLKKFVNLFKVKLIIFVCWGGLFWVLFLLVVLDKVIIFIVSLRFILLVLFFFFIVRDFFRLILICESGFWWRWCSWYMFGWLLFVVWFCVVWKVIWLYFERWECIMVCCMWLCMMRRSILWWRGIGCCCGRGGWLVIGCNGIL